MPTFEQPPQVAVQSQLASVPNMPQVQGVASQAVDASRGVAPAIQATSFPGLLSSLWSGLGGLRGSARRAALLRPKGLDMTHVPVQILLFRPEGQGSCQQRGLWPLLAQTPNLASKTLVSKLRKPQPQL